MMGIGVDPELPFERTLTTNDELMRTESVPFLITVILLPPIPQ